MRATTALAALLAITSCGMGVKVTRLGPDRGIPPRPSDCAVEFLDKAPARAHEEIAELESHVTTVPREGPLVVLREPACRLGADAVIVTRNFVTNMFGHVMVAGTAIRWIPEAASPFPEDGKPAPTSD